MIRRPPRSTQSRSSAASDVYKRQPLGSPSPTWPPTSWRARPAAADSPNSHLGVSPDPKRWHRASFFSSQGPPPCILVRPSLPMAAGTWHERQTGDSRDGGGFHPCLLYTSPSPRDGLLSRMPS